MSMKTFNERVQGHLAEAMKAARTSSVPSRLEDGYCAAYLAQKLARIESDKALAFTAVERDQLADWAADNEDYVREVFRDLDHQEIIDLFRLGEFAFGDYVIGKAVQAMLDDLACRDAEPCHLRDDDMRSRVRDANREYAILSRHEDLGGW
jgi:hypothetical protein